MSELNTRKELDMPYQRELVESATRAAVGELVRAIGKFPTWPTVLTNQTPAHIAHTVKWMQGVNDGTNAYAKSAADTIIIEEILETIESAQKGDLEAARIECIQAMAMLLRLYIHLPAYCNVEAK